MRRPILGAMGWKNVKTHYRIGHIVSASPNGICIGSHYVPNIIEVARDGRILKRCSNRVSEDLSRYQAEMDADAALLARLISEPDTFEASLPVYTFEDGRVVEKRCEAYGWPNVTHDGLLMYENTFSHDRAQVIEWARADVACALRVASRDVADAERQLAEARSRAEVAAKRYSDFNAAFPLAGETEVTP